MLLSYQGYTIKELSHIFQVDRITIYTWFDHWGSRRFAGLYDRAGKGRPPLFNQDQKEQIRDWIKQYPKNLNKIMALIQQEFNSTASLVTQGTNLSSQGAISPTCLRHFQWSKETYKQRIRGDFTEVSL